jgi:hypothetical protein
MRHMLVGLATVNPGGLQYCRVSLQINGYVIVSGGNPCRLPDTSEIHIVRLRRGGDAGDISGRCR